MIMSFQCALKLKAEFRKLKQSSIIKPIGLTGKVDQSEDTHSSQITLSH